jgi:hypothetical protein
LPDVVPAETTELDTTRSEVRKTVLEKVPEKSTDDTVTPRSQAHMLVGVVEPKIT